MGVHQLENDAIAWLQQLAAVTRECQHLLLLRVLRALFVPRCSGCPRCIWASPRVLFSTDARRIPSR